MSRRTHWPLAAAGPCALLLACALAAAARAEVDLQLSPVSQTVTPGSEFEIQLQVTNASPAFNAFHVIVAFDPGALTAVKLSPVSLQLGPLVTDACTSVVNWFHPGAGADTTDVSMMCPDSSATGPGMVYRLHFLASTTPQLTSLTILPDAEFANAGVLVPGVLPSGAAVGIGVSPTLDAGGAPAGAALALTAWPNPARGAVSLDFGRPLGAGGTLAILDVQGRMLRRFELPPGARTGAWDGRDGSGAPVPPGQYLVALRAGGLLRTVRITRVP